MPTGATRASRDRARAAAQTLLAGTRLDQLATEARHRVGALADEIWTASRANRDLLENLISAEVERAATRLGFARREDVIGLQASIDRLRAEVAGLRAERAEAAPTSAEPPA